MGINPVYPRSAVRVWTAELDGKGYLHPADEVTAVFTPHLASWWAPPRQREMQNDTDDSRFEALGARSPIPPQRPSMNGLSA